MSATTWQAGDFCGGWSMARRIEDRRAGQVITGQGGLTVTPEDGLLQLEEVVCLQLPGAGHVEGRQSYLWYLQGCAVQVHFPDGRAFHEFRAEGMAEGSSHLCGADTYRVRYDFTGRATWTATWQVAGPRKDYTMTTEYRRHPS